MHDLDTTGARHASLIGHLVLGLLLVAATCPAASPPTRPAGPATVTPEEGGTRLLMRTSMGDLKIRLLDDDAPLTVAHVLALVDAGFYDGTVFHRVMPNLIQGGGYTATLEQKPQEREVRNEAATTPSNRRGTLALVHKPSRPQSGTSEFFINVQDNTYLDHRDRTPGGFGWAVFGEIIDGMEIVDAIAALPRGARGQFVGDVPRDGVIIESIRRIEE